MRVNNFTHYYNGSVTYNQINQIVVITRPQVLYHKLCIALSSA